MMQNPNIPEDWKQTIRGYVPEGRTRGGGEGGNTDPD